MARRVSLPAADDLFRPTASTTDTAAESPAESPADTTAESPDEGAAPAENPSKPAKRRSSGRIRHDEKMTVYVTADELIDIEHARLALRRDHGLAIDRGRLVREAIAIALAEMEHDGADSTIVQRLSVS